MALYVKYPKTCRNKKQSAAFLTPPDSSLSSSSGSLSSSNSERKQHPKRKPLRFKGHTTLIAVVTPRRKKLKTKKSSTINTSGSDSECCTRHKNNNLQDEMNRNSLYSLCKSFYYCLISIKTAWLKHRVWCVMPCEYFFPVVQKSLWVSLIFIWKSCRIITDNRLNLLKLQQCPGLEWTSAGRLRSLCTLSLTTMSPRAIKKQKFCARFVTIWRRTRPTAKRDIATFIYKWVCSHQL